MRDKTTQPSVGEYGVGPKEVKELKSDLQLPDSCSWTDDQNRVRNLIPTSDFLLQP